MKRNIKKVEDKSLINNFEDEINKIFRAKESGLNQILVRLRKKES